MLTITVVIYYQNRWMQERLLRVLQPRLVLAYQHCIDIVPLHSSFKSYAASSPSRYTFLTDQSLLPCGRGS